MSSILIGFASHYGQTEKVAARLGEHLRAMGHEVDLANFEAKTVAPPPQDYDVVVLGTRIEIGKYAPSFGEYVRRHRTALAEVPTGLFAVSMAASSPGTDPEGYLAKICDELAWQPTHRIAIAGALKYRSYGFITRLVMKLISGRAGRSTDTSRDHEFTNWEVVRMYAEDIAALCPRDGAVAGQR